MNAFHRTVLLTCLFAATVVLPDVSVAQGAEGEAAVTRGREVIALLSRGAYDRVDAAMTQQMKAQMPEGGMKTVWTDITRPLGTLKSCDEPEASNQQEFQAVTFTCVFGDSGARLRLVFDAKGYLAGFFLGPPKKR